MKISRIPVNRKHAVEAIRRLFFTEHSGSSLKRMADQSAYIGALFYIPDSMMLVAVEVEGVACHPEKRQRNTFARSA